MAIKSVEAFLEKSGQWQEMLTTFRELALQAGMDEAVKWGMPVYSFQNKNVLGISAFKSYAGIWFYQGALLKDEKGVLMNAQEGKTRAMRQWRFTPEDKISRQTILRYMKEAMQLVADGREIKPQRNKTLVIPEELQEALKKDQQLRQSFDSMSLSHRREYADYISEAKQAATRERRLGKVVDTIKTKKGLNDQYK